jgi:hypothetical protein
MEYEMLRHTSINGKSGIVIKGLKKSGKNSKKKFNRFCTKKAAVLGKSRIILKVL